MRIARAFAALLSFYSHIISINAQIHCEGHRRGGPTVVGDCYAALDLIPDGPGQHYPPFGNHLPNGKCFIDIWPEEPQPEVPWDRNHATHVTLVPAHGDVKALFEQLFQPAKKLAKSIIETCVPEARTGIYGGYALIEMFAGQHQKHLGTYRVRVLVK
jgi:hypothetical protein